MHKKRKFRHLQKCTETAVYRYFVGFLILLSETVKKGCKALVKNITEMLVCLSIVGMVTAANAFDKDAINYTTAILFITILAVLIATLIKVKILERGGKN